MSISKSMSMSMLEEGKRKEREFAKLLRNSQFSTKNEDMLDHWDVKVELKIDVKGLRKVNRGDNEVNENYHFVEIKNVLGETGWLYGKADLFAFELNDYWVVVGKETLQEFVSKKVKKEYVSTSYESLYRLYSRKGTKDIITMVKSIDLLAMAEEVIKKKEV